MSDFYKGRKVLVTGGTGTIGSCLVKRLVELGSQVSVISLDSKERAEAVLDRTVIFSQADLRDYKVCMDAMEGQEYVFNLMAVKGNTQRGLSKVASAYVPFLLCNTNIMDAAFKKGVSRFMFVGSIGEYPEIDIRHEDDVWNGPPAANDKYMGIAKRAGEAQAETYLYEYGWDAVRIVRLSNVYGPYDDFDPRTAHVIPALISRASNGENPLNVAGDGSAVRDFIYLDDVVRGMLRALEKAPPCVPINLGSGKGVTIKETAETIVKCLGNGIYIKWDSSRPTGDKKRVLEVSRAKELLDFEAEISLCEGIKKTIEWYCAHRDLADRRGRELHG